MSKLSLSSEALRGCSLNLLVDSPSSNMTSSGAARSHIPCTQPTSIFSHTYLQQQQREDTEAAVCHQFTLITTVHTFSVGDLMITVTTTTVTMIISQSKYEYSSSNSEEKCPHRTFCGFVITSTLIIMKVHLTHRINPHVAELQTWLNLHQPRQLHGMNTVTGWEASKLAHVAVQRRLTSKGGRALQPTDSTVNWKI